MTYKQINDINRLYKRDKNTKHFYIISGKNYRPVIFNNAKKVGTKYLKIMAFYIDDKDVRYLTLPSFKKAILKRIK